MHVPALTAVSDTPSVPAYGGAVPRQLSSVAFGRGPRSTSTPFVPEATIFASSSSVSHAGRGWSSVPRSLLAPSEVDPAAATLAPTARRTAAARAATINSFRIYSSLESDVLHRGTPRFPLFSIPGFAVEPSG